MNKVAANRTISAARRKEALAKGDKIYESATRCSRCDSTERYVSTRSCVPCTKAKNRERRAKEKELPCLLEYHLINTLPGNSAMALICRHL